MLTPVVTMILLFAILQLRVVANFPHYGVVVVVLQIVVFGIVVMTVGAVLSHIICIMALAPPHLRVVVVTSVLLMVKDGLVVNTMGVVYPLMTTQPHTLVGGVQKVV